MSNFISVIFEIFFLCVNRNFGLLSFGAEAEEDEEQTISFVQKNSGKPKSTHDILEDPKLSKETATFVKLGTKFSSFRMQKII